MTTCTARAVSRKMIGGNLFGILGIIFFIPLTAVVIELVKEDACRRLQTNGTQT